MKIYNNNPAFGDCGPFDVDAPTFRLSCHLLANDMQANFKTWAKEMYDDAINKGVGIESRANYMMDTVQGLRRKFLAGLAEVVRCDACGQDYHSDATEIGHADNCSRRSETVDEDE